MKVEGTNASVLQYAGDTLVFLEDNLMMDENLKGLLLWFEVAIGLNLNTVKTKVYQVNESDYFTLVSNL